MKNYKRAFSLIELSIVVLIIAVLIAGVLQGSRLYKSFKINTAKTITQSSPVSGIKGLVLWLEPTSEKSFIASETSKGSSITKWYDINPQLKEGNIFDATETTSYITYEEEAINDLPAVRFSASYYDDDAPYLAGDVIVTPDNAYTVFIVSKADDLDSEPYLLTIGTNFAISKMSYAGGKYSYFGHDSKGGSMGTIQYSTKPLITTATLSPSAVNGVTVTQYAQSWLNGANDGAAVALTGTIFKPTESTNIGNSSRSMSTPWNGLISEVIIYDNKLSDSNRKAVEKYLGQKYGIFVS